METHQSHKLKIGGSNPSPATKYQIVNDQLFVYEFNLADVVDTQIIIDSFEKYKKNFESKKHKLMHNCYVSGYDVHKNTENFNEILNLIESLTNQNTNELINNTSVRVNWKIYESWLASYDKFGYQENHCHFPFGYSAIYYILAEDTSNIVFNDTVIKPYTGMLLIFPGMTLHKVMPVLNHHTSRIVLACNLYPTFDYSYFNQQQ